jgi:hypothetical protein
MVTLYERDAIVVRDGLNHLADFFKGDPDRPKDATPLLRWMDELSRASNSGTAADHPSQRGNLAAARLASIVAAIEEQLPKERRVPSPPANLGSD